MYIIGMRISGTDRITPWSTRCPSMVIVIHAVTTHLSYLVKIALDRGWQKS